MNTTRPSNRLRVEPPGEPSATDRSPIDPSPTDPARRRFCAAAPALGLSLVGAGLLGGCASPPGAPAALRHAVVPFSAAGEGGAVAAGWRPYVMRPDRIRTVYETVRRDGLTVLHATADSASSGMHCSVDIDPRATPWLRWQWRVEALSERATVADDDAEDTPARLVVAFGGDMDRLSLRDRIFFEQVEVFTGNVLPFATLTYVWDGQLPVGSVLPYARSGRIRYQVVESGARRAGRWLAYERNVLEDYTRVFGEPPSGHVSGVGLLTDSDDLKNHAEAWYGDIAFEASRTLADAPAGASPG